MITLFDFLDKLSFKQKKKKYTKMYILIHFDYIELSFFSSMFLFLSDNKKNLKFVKKFQYKVIDTYEYFKQFS